VTTGILQTMEVSFKMSETNGKNCVAKPPQVHPKALAKGESGRAGLNAKRTNRRQGWGKSNAKETAARRCLKRTKVNGERDKGKFEK
jgi:hypothetical protein